MSIRFQIVAIGAFTLLSTLACSRSEQPRQVSYNRPPESESSHRTLNEHQRPASAPADFDYYVLSLSWAPTFCENPEHRHARECDPRQQAGFVVHGLWPQRDHSRGPEDCNPSRPLDETAMREASQFMPDPGLARHEWRAHGTCSGLSPDQYFATIKQALQKVNIPPSYRSPQRGLRTSPSLVERKFAQSSHIDQPGAIRVHCLGNQLSEVRVCFTKTLEPRSCTETAGECRASQIFMPPVR